MTPRPGKDRGRARRRAARGGRGYDGITDEQVYRRDKWVCLMPACACPDGRVIDPALTGLQEPWAPSVDHVIPLSQGGLDNAPNKRAAHAKCNQEAASEDQRDPEARRRQRERDIAADVRQPQPLTWTVAEILAVADDHRGGRVFLTMEELRAAWAAVTGEPAAGEPRS